jgi:hypothetical protein
MIATIFVVVIGESERAKRQSIASRENSSSVRRLNASLTQLSQWMPVRPGRVKPLRILLVDRVIVSSGNVTLSTLTGIAAKPYSRDRTDLRGGNDVAGRDGDFP